MASPLADCIVVAGDDEDVRNALPVPQGFDEHNVDGNTNGDLQSLTDVTSRPAQPSSHDHPPSCPPPGDTKPDGPDLLLPRPGPRLYGVYDHGGRTHRLAWDVNRTYSPLYRLPDAVILRIAQHSNFVTRQMLRRTSGLCMRAVARMDFSRLEDERNPASMFYAPDLDGPDGDEDLVWSRQVWPLHGTKAQRLEKRGEMAALLRRGENGRCIRCRLRTELGTGAVMLNSLRGKRRCSKCCKSHSLFFFSPAQRRNRDDNSRVCIGWEGKVPICQHQWLDYGHLTQVAAAETLMAMATSGTPPSMTTTGPGQGGQPKDLDFAACQDQSHVSRSLGGKLRRLEIARDKESGDAFLFWEAVKYLLLIPYRVVARGSLETYLLWLRDTTSMGQPFPCPHVDFTDGQLLLPFERNQCACFEYDEISAQGSEKPFKPLSHSRDCNCCRCRAVKDPSRQG